MNPLELEMFHQIKNVIGVNPTFYEFVFTVDADTTVDTLSLNRLVSQWVLSDLEFLVLIANFVVRIAQHGPR